MAVAAGRDAVVQPEGRQRRAQPAALADPAAAERTAVAARVGVGDGAVSIARGDQAELVLQRRFVQRPAGDRHVALLPAVRVHVPGKAAAAAVGRGHAGDDLVAAHHCGREQRRVQQPLRDARVLDLDRAADRAAAEAHRRGPAPDGGPRGQQRLGHDRVVGAEGRRIVRAGAADGDAHARARLAADHRQADVGAEAGVGHAGFVLQRGAERGRDAAAQRLAAQHLYRLGRRRGMALALHLHAVGRLRGGGRQQQAQQPGLRGQRPQGAAGTLHRTDRRPGLICNRIAL